MLEERMKSVFLQALEQVPAVRDSYLEEACKGNPKLRLEVAALLRAHEQAGDFLRKTPRLSGQGAGAGAAIEAQRGRSYVRCPRPQRAASGRRCYGAGGRRSQCGKDQDAINDFEIESD